MGEKRQIYDQVNELTQLIKNAVVTVCGNVLRIIQWLSAWTTALVAVDERRTLSSRVRSQSRRPVRDAGDDRRMASPPLTSRNGGSSTIHRPYSPFLREIHRTRK